MEKKSKLKIYLPIILLSSLIFIVLIYAQEETGFNLKEYLKGTSEGDNLELDCPSFTLTDVENYNKLTIKDQCTGLVWASHELSTYKVVSDPNPGYTWQEAKDSCENLVIDGADSLFRLPTVEELLTLISYTCTNNFSEGNCSAKLSDQTGAGGDPFFSSGIYWTINDFHEPNAWTDINAKPTPGHPDRNYKRSVNLLTGEVDSPVFGDKTKLNAWCIMDKSPEMLDKKFITSDTINITNGKKVTLGSLKTMYNRRCTAPADCSIIPNTVCMEMEVCPDANAHLDPATFTCESNYQDCDLGIVGACNGGANDGTLCTSHAACAGEECVDWIINDVQEWNQGTLSYGLCAAQECLYDAELSGVPATCICNTGVGASIREGICTLCEIDEHYSGNTCISNVRGDCSLVPEIISDEWVGGLIDGYWDCVFKECSTVAPGFHEEPPGSEICVANIASCTVPSAQDPQGLTQTAQMSWNGFAWTNCYATSCIAGATLIGSAPSSYCELNLVTLSGNILNAQTGSNLANVTVSVTVGPNDYTTASNAVGNYVLDVPAGIHDVNASLAGFLPGLVPSLDINTNTVQDIQLLPASFAGKALIIIVKWNGTPFDVDAHLYTPEPSEIYFINKITPNAQLDKDTVAWSGIETISINTFLNGTYTYFPFDYGDKDGWGNTTTVSVWDGTGMLLKQYKSSNQLKKYWKVFTVNGSTGMITDIDTYSDSKP